MIELEQKVSSPKKAVFKVVQSLHEDSDSRAALIVTVHKTDGGSAGNIWERRGGVAHRVIPERELPSKPEPDILLGEILRLVEQMKDKPVDTEEYLRPRLGLVGLFHQAKEVAANHSVKGRRF